MNKEVCNHRNDCPYWDCDYVSCNNCKYRVEKLEEQVKRLEKENQQLEKSLDKACEYMSNRELRYSEKVVMMEIEHGGLSKEQWKNYFMKEVREND